MDFFKALAVCDPESSGSDDDKRMFSSETAADVAQVTKNG